MTFRELGWIAAEAAKTACKILERQHAEMDIEPDRYVERVEGLNKE